MAALQGREEVGEEDIRTTADLALVHRMRRKPFQDLDLDQQKLEDIMGGPSHRHLHAHAINMNGDWLGLGRRALLYLIAAKSDLRQQ